MRFLQIGAYHIRKIRLISRVYTFVLRALGVNIGIGTILPFSTNMDWPHRVSLGAHCQLKEHVRLHFDGAWGRGKCIVIGDNVFLGQGVEFNISHSISIGRNTLIGSGVRFVDHDHGTQRHKNIREQYCVGAPIEIGCDCWIGSNCIILKGVVVEDKAVIGAGSLVLNNIPEGEIWAGTPARKIGARS